MKNWRVWECFVKWKMKQSTRIYNINHVQSIIIPRDSLRSWKYFVWFLLVNASISITHFVHDTCIVVQVEYIEMLVKIDESSMMKQSLYVQYVMVMGSDWSFIHLISNFRYQFYFCRYMKIIESNHRRNRTSQLFSLEVSRVNAQFEILMHVTYSLPDLSMFHIIYYFTADLNFGDCQFYF